MKKLTVMVSLYEAGQFIENRLDNLRGSTIYNDIEIWVVNANSPDPLDHIIPHKLQSPNLKYIKLEERIGVYAAWNLIITSSNSQYITNANADDLIAPHGYEKLAAVLDHEADFAYPSWYATDVPNLTWQQVPDRSDTEGMPGIYKGSLEGGGVGHFPMWKRKLHQNLGMFDERFKALGDADWWARCYHRGKAKFVWHGEHLACYLWRHGNNLWHRAINEDEWSLYHNNAIGYEHGRK